MSTLTNIHVDQGVPITATELMKSAAQDEPFCAIDLGPSDARVTIFLVSDVDCDRLIDAVSRCRSALRMHRWHQIDALDSVPGNPPVGR